MIHFEENVSIVMNDLGRYGYLPKVIHRERNHLNNLRSYIAANGIATFSLDMAMEWCRREVTPSEQRPYRLSINRLNDVYGHGRILASHIRIFGELSESFRNAVDDYLEYIPPYTEGTREWYRMVCGHFCRFAQLYNADSPEEISYDILKAYHSFVKEGGTYRHYETQISNFLDYLSRNGRCRGGHAACMFFGKFGRAFTVSDLSREGMAGLDNLKGMGPGNTADGFYNSIPKFREGLLSLGYEMQSSAGIVCYLKWLYIFLDSAGIGYSREAADLWARSAAGKAFPEKFVPAALRSFDLYDDYIQKGRIFPEKYNPRRPSNYGNLAAWCKTAVDSFVDDRKREGKAEGTIRQNRSHITKFCLFLESENLTSFAELTPDLIKKSLLQNKKLAIGTRRSYNYGVREFLIRMELRGEIRAGIHLAVPRLCAESEKIVTVLNETDLSSIDVYCGSASSPIELRDAAMLKLGLNTALRGIDVVSLQLSDIDWKNRLIRVIQSKTKVGHIHPVDVDTLNAVFLYLKDGRPKKAKGGSVFISTKAPYGPLRSSACSEALERAGASVTEFHRIRRTYATDTLRAGATIAETAELLGHSDTNSVHKYTVLDDKRMRLCPLSQEEMGLVLKGRYAHA